MQRTYLVTCFHGGHEGKDVANVTGSKVSQRLVTPAASKLALDPVGDSIDRAGQLGIGDRLEAIGIAIDIGGVLAVHGVRFRGSDLIDPGGKRRRRHFGRIHRRVRHLDHSVRPRRARKTVTGQGRARGNEASRRASRRCEWSIVVPASIGFYESSSPVPGLRYSCPN